MLDPKLVRQDKQRVIKSYEGEDIPFLLEEYDALDQQWRLLLQKVDQLKQKRNP